VTDPDPNGVRAARPIHRSRAAIIVAIVAVVAVGAAAAVGLGKGPGTSPSPSVAASAIVAGTARPSATGTASSSASRTPVASQLPSDGSSSPTPSNGTPGLTPSASASPSSRPGVVARRIVIPRLGINLPVVKGDGVDAPIGKAAHFPGTGWPHGGTNIYLYAHARDGMFINLWNANVGDEIDLTLVDGSTARYTVTQILPKVAWDAVSYLDPTPTEQLTLQTCTSYQDTAPRFLVIAVPAQ
jgi:LPXTG-site transpeptidase (sortase) family protein